MARSANVKKEKERDGLSEELKRRLREAGALLLLPLALYLLVCLFSYNDQDPSWGHVGTAEHARNFGGAVGANIANVLRYIFGLVSYCFPLLLLVLGVQVLRNRGETNVQPWEPSLRLIGSVFFFITAPALLYLNFHDEPVLPQGVGGIIGMWVGRGLMHALGRQGRAAVAAGLVPGRRDPRHGPVVVRADGRDRAGRRQVRRLVRRQAARGAGRVGGPPGTRRARSGQEGRGRQTGEARTRTHRSAAGAGGEERAGQTGNADSAVHRRRGAG